MNERIKQLADQALKECDDAKERGIDQYSKRFAELIVRECQHRVEQYINECGEIASMPKSVIMKHFGVEE